MNIINLCMMPFEILKYIFILQVDNYAKKHTFIQFTNCVICINNKTVD